MELKFLLDLLQCQLEPTFQKTLFKFQYRELSWNRFVSLVIRHRLVTVIYLKLQELNLELPEDAAERLKSRFELERKKNFILNASLVKLNQALEKEVRVIWFKGVLQSQRMYDNPLVRSYSDLDLFIDKKDLYQVDKILRANGYFPDNDWTAYSSSHFSKYAEIIKEIAYVNRTTKVCIDLHWNLVFAKQLLPYTFEEFYAESIVFDVHTNKLRTLGEEHNFFYLNIHGCFDNWKTLSQLLDITFTLKKNPVLEKSYRQFIEENKLSKKLLLGIDLSNYLFHEKGQTPLHLTSFLQSYEDEKLDSPSEKYYKIKRFFRVGSFHSSLNYKLISFEANMFYGDNKDLWRLPRHLFFLYYLSMPFRWLGRKIHHKK